MDDLSRLPANERAKRYRQLADDARHEAAQVASDASGVRESYLIIAGQFDHLALLAEAGIPHPG
jgi:hypothetical protein